MKNSYCDLDEDQILELPKRFHGFLLSPFQFNLYHDYVHVPADTFKEMVDILVERAQLQKAQDINNAAAPEPTAAPSTQPSAPA